MNQLGFPGNTNGLKNEGRKKFPPKDFKMPLECDDNLLFQHSEVFSFQHFFLGIWKKKIETQLLFSILKGDFINSISWGPVFLSFLPLHKLKGTMGGKQAVYTRYLNSNEPSFSTLSQG
jgi:hypothetical protein